MNERLINTLEEAQVEGRVINVFFRDDDVDKDEDNLRRLLDLFIAQQTPVNLEVIPGSLTDAAIRMLRQCPASLVELNQHGWRHVNHEREGRKCEFGASRSYEQQLEDIGKGRRRMNEAFGDGWSPVFTPPWNRCVEETFRALDQLGFAALSKSHDKHPATGYGFREISITFDLYRWKGEPAMKSPESIAEGLAAQLNELDTIGIMLHHKVMDSTAFFLLERLIEMLRVYPGVRFHTFQSLLSLHNAGRRGNWLIK
jgi:Polysaccharide deacetylase